MPSKHSDKWYREQAQIQFEKEGTLEFDDTPAVSRNDTGDNGAYVQCWVWVPDDNPRRRSRVTTDMISRT